MLRKKPDKEETSDFIGKIFNALWRIIKALATGIYKLIQWIYKKFLK